MNQDEDLPQQHDSELASLFGAEEPDPKDETIAALEEKVTRLQNDLHEERFVWIVILVVLCDSVIFSFVDNWGGALVIGVFQLIGVVVLADRLEVDTVQPLIDKLAGIARKATGSDE